MGVALHHLMIRDLKLNCEISNDTPRHIQEIHQERAPKADRPESMVAWL